MKNCASKLLGLALLFSLTGCCCGTPGLWPFCNSGGYGGYSSGYGSGHGGGCPDGNCGAAPGIIPQGAYYPNYNTTQAGLPMPAADPIAAGAVPYRGSYGPQTAALESLPTY